MATKHWSLLFDLLAFASYWKTQVLNATLLALAVVAILPREDDAS
jgi:hypothetical protein